MINPFNLLMEYTLGAFVGPEIPGLPVQRFSPAELAEAPRPALIWLQGPWQLETVRAIVADGRHQRDAFVLADWWLYEPGACATQHPSPAHADALEIRRLLAPTHRCFPDGSDMGYLVVRPRTCC